MQQTNSDKTNPYEKYLDSAFENASELLAKDLLDSLPTDHELYLNVQPPPDLLDNIKKAVNKQQKSKRPKVSKILLVAAIIVFLGTMFAAFSVTALRINIFNTVLEAKNSTFQLLLFNKPKVDKINNDNLTIFEDLYKAKKDLKFLCLVPTYIPDSIGYSSFEIMKDGKRLNIDFSEKSKKLKIVQEYDSNQSIIKGNSLDTNNTEVFEYEIMGRKASVFHMKNPTDDSIFIKCNIDSLSISVYSDLNVSEIKKILESFNELK